MFERCEERSTELLLDELLEKGIIVDGCLLWQGASDQMDGGSEPSLRGLEDQDDASIPSEAPKRARRPAREMCE